VKKKGIIRWNDRKYEETILIVDSIIALPGGESGKVTNEASDDEFEGEMVGIVMEALEKAGDKGIPKKDLVKVVFNAFKTDKVKVSKAMGLLGNDEFLKNGPWTFEGGVVK